MVEEFRTMLDRFVLSLINKKQFGKKDFTTLENGAVALKDDARQLFLKAWHDRKQQTLYHDWFEEAVPLTFAALTGDHYGSAHSRRYR